ncbi:MAG: amino acid adenylation domain-containing protein, partial [Vicinamibacterales bacterium]
LWTDRTVDTIAAILGIWKAGGAYVPVDPAWPQDRIDLVLGNAGVRVIVAPAACASALTRDPRTVVAVDESAEEQAPDSRTSLESAAYVMYTSGSTSQPNGVVVTHGSALNLAAALTRTIYGTLQREARRHAPLRVGVNGPWIFDTTIKQIVQLVSGHTLDLLPDACRTDPARFLRHVREHQVEVVDCTPSQLRLLIAGGLLDDPALAPLVVLVGGEAVDPALWTRLTSAGDRVFFNLYGPTECTVDATLAPIAAPTTGPTIGRPLLNVRAYVLDPQLRPCPIGVPGELWIAGAGVARGYLHAPALTARRFLPDPLAGEPGARMYYTGDRARTRTTGELEYLGRADDALKVRGIRMAPQEAEAVLMTHPTVHAAAVVAHARTDEDVRLVAYVTPRDGRQTRPADLRRFLREHVPAHLVPSAFVELEALPLTPNGKLDRRALPAPDLSRAESGRDFVPPRDDVEAELAGIWTRCLGLDRVGVADDFFELGGHSLVAMIMLGCVKATFGCDVPIAVLFRGGTIEQLAAHIRRSAESDTASPLVPLRTSGTGPPFFCVHPVGGGVLCYRDLVEALGGHPFYGLQVARNGSIDGVPSVERMAAQYREAIRTVQPNGPYRLGGWSLGGLIAFEMARALQAAGEDIALVALLDSHATAPSRQRPISDESILRRFAEDMLGDGAAGTSALTFEELHARAMAAGLLPPGSDLGQLRALVERFRDNLRAAAEYRPAPAPLRVLLLQAADSLRDAADATFGWDRVALCGVERRVVPGNHYSIMRSPGVEALAAELTTWIAAGGVTRLAALGERA